MPRRLPNTHLPADTCQPGTVLFTNQICTCAGLRPLGLGWGGWGGMCVGGGGFSEGKNTLCVKREGRNTAWRNPTSGQDY